MRKITAFIDRHAFLLMIICYLIVCFNREAIVYKYKNEIEKLNLKINNLELKIKINNMSHEQNTKHFSERIY